MDNVSENRVRNFLLRLQKRETWMALRGWALKQKVSAALMVVGAILLGYVGSEYVVMYREQQALHRQWQEQQSSPSPDALTEAASRHDGLTRVSIPKIDLDVIVVEGTNRKALRLGPGHLKNTPAPGEAGNSVISAHRDTFFRHIYDLKDGDEINVRRDGRAYKFQVIGKKIVTPNDVSVLKKSSDARLTLITCYPIYYIGPAPKRLVVFSKLVSTSQAGPQRAQTAQRNRRHS
jgi:sortase A